MSEENEKLLDRILKELDTCATKLEGLSKVVAENSVLLKIVSRIVFCLVLALLTGSIAFGFELLKKNAEITALRKHQAVISHTIGEKDGK